MTATLKSRKILYKGYFLVFPYYEGYISWEVDLNCDWEEIYTRDKRVLLIGILTFKKKLLQTLVQSPSSESLGAGRMVIYLRLLWYRRKLSCSLHLRIGILWFYFQWLWETFSLKITTFYLNSIWTTDYFKTLILIIRNLYDVKKEQDVKMRQWRRGRNFSMITGSL